MTSTQPKARLLNVARWLDRWRTWPTWARWLTIGLAAALAAFVAWRVGLGIKAFVAAALGIGGAAATGYRLARQGRAETEILAHDVQAFEDAESARDEAVDGELRELARPTPDDFTPDAEPERPQSHFLERYRR